MGFSDKRTALYAVCIVLLGLVASLAVKRYGQDNGYQVGVETNASSTDAGRNTGTDGQGEESTSEQPLVVCGDVEYVELPYDSDGDETDNYNGEELVSNGCTYAIKVNRQENIVTVYSLDGDGGYTVSVKVMRCSVAPDGGTPVGLYTMSNKWRWLALYDNCYGQYVSQITGDILFHSVPYTSMSEASLETWEFNKLGTAASLGCVRLCVADARWIYENCERGTYINIFDSDYYGPLGRPVPVAVLDDTENEGWDPTDMDEDSPLAGSPAIYGVESHSIELGESFDSMAGVWAFDSDRQDATDRLSVTGSVDSTTAGEYSLRYSFNDKGQTVSKEITITVEDKIPPAVTQLPARITLESYAGQSDGLAQLVALCVTAVDNGGVVDICVNTDSVESEPGVYPVTCHAVDAAGNTSGEFTIEIAVAN